MLAEWVVVDWESQSACEIKSAGAERYCADETTRATCLGYAWPEGEPELWIAGQPPPAGLCDHVRAGRRVLAHNIAFDFNLWAAERKRDSRWPELKLEQTECILSRARALALPASFENLCLAIRFPAGKDKEGQAALRKIMRPRSKEPLVFWTPETAPREFELVYRYCKNDAAVERALHKYLPPLSDDERELWLIDQEINQRGVRLDVPNIKRALAILEAEKEELSARAMKLAGFRPTQRAVLLAWLQQEGINLENLQKGTVAKVLADPDAFGKSENAKVILELRQQASKVSTAKFKRMLANVCDDYRARGLYAFCGANTRRWAARLWQPQNLVRMTKQFTAECAADVIAWLKFSNAVAAIRHEYGEVMQSLALAMRSFIIASPGCRLVSADFSNIEGRVLAWLAGEEWKLEAFRKYDAGTGHDLYKLAFANSFGVAVESVNDDQRQSGKVQELALGFAGAIGAILKMCIVYFVKPSAIAAAVRAAVPVEEWDATAKRLPKLGNKLRCDLEPDVWTGLRIVVDRWRAAHPKTCEYWKALEEAVHVAMSQPGAVGVAGRVKYRLNGDFLECKLPSGGLLRYPYPSYKRYPSFEWESRRDELRHDIADAMAMGEHEAAQAYTDELSRHELPENITWETTLTCWSESLQPGQSTKVWQCRKLTRSILIENVVQAVARDRVAVGMKNVRAAGYPIVMHAHDEIVADTPLNHGSVTDFAHKMCAQLPWADGLPVVAAGWEGQRYRK